MCAGLVLHLLGDVVYLDQQAVGRYVEGGPLDLTWLVGVALVASSDDGSSVSPVDQGDVQQQIDGIRQLIQDNTKR